MKILYVHTVSLDSNKANVLQALHMCEAFAGHGHDVRLFAPFNKDKKSPVKTAQKKIIKDSLLFSIVNYRQINVFGRLRNLISLRPCLKIVQEKSFDLIYIRNLFLYLCISRKFSKTVHESHYHYHDHLFGKIISWVLERILTCQFRAYPNKRMIAISENLKKYWVAKGILAHQIFVAHDGVDLRFFENSQDQVYYRDQLKLPRDCKIATYAGSLRHDRDISQIIKLAKTYPEVLFCIIGGESSEIQKIKNNSDLKFLKNIRILGYQITRKVYEYLKASDILLMIWSKRVPTMDYCSPLKMFEYLASGRMIVGHRFPSIEEVIQSEIHAFLVSPGSFSELNQAFRKALNMPIPNFMTQNAKQLVQLYTWERRASTILKNLDISGI